MLLGHRQAFAWLDEWIDMTLEDVRKYEAQLQQQTNTLFKESQGDIGNAAEAVEGDETKEIQSVGLSAPQTPRTPKSPAKKGYFNWF